MLSVRSLDLLRDQQLRQWARTHYVPLAERSPAWHPTVLEEMLNIDCEQIDEQLQQKGALIVPLEQGPQEQLRHDAAETQVRKPKMKAAQSQVNSEYYYG